MSTHKHFDKICCVVIALTLVLTLFLMKAEAVGDDQETVIMGYEKKLFDTSRVHEIQIVMEDWEDFIANCESEEYSDCTIIVDEEVYKNVAIRAKGNTSLTQVSSYGNDRYSFKIEFDHYDSANTYHGLDKLSLNNVIQDNTYMKEYLTYQMMEKMGVSSPLCSYTYITVNGEDWGLYLALEGIEDSFLKRNYGNTQGELYKPESMNMDRGSEMPQGGFRKGEFQQEEMPQGGFPQGEFPKGEMPQGGFPKGERQRGDMSQRDFPQGDFSKADRGFQMGGRADSDVLLNYVDDNVESYKNIFDNAKTDITDADKKRLIQALKKLSEKKDISETVDIEEVIRYFVVHNFVLNFDSYTGSMVHNYYLYENDGQMQMIPWDYNLAFGGFQAMEDATTLVNYPIDSPVSGGDTANRPMIAWIFDKEEYIQQYHANFEEFISGYFENEEFITRFDKTAEMIAPYVEKDPTKFCSYEEFEKGVSTLRELCLLRAKSIRGQLDGDIGTTIDTQDRSTFIKAENLEIKDMGTMEGMGGGRNHKQRMWGM